MKSLREIIINESNKTNILSGSVDVEKLTKKLPYLKKDLNGIKGDVDLVIKDTIKPQNAKYSVDPYSVFVYQNGKELAFYGTIPALPRDGYKISDNYK